MSILQHVMSELESKFEQTITEYVFFILFGKGMGDKEGLKCGIKDNLHQLER
jgi:hypothetical protein